MPALATLRSRLPLPLRWRALGSRLLKAFGRAYPRAKFIEIGANDGDFGSAIRQFVLEGEWTGVMVEPSPRAFAGLRENYGGIERVVLENAAIHLHDGRAPFFELDDGVAPGRDAPDRQDWERALGSLEREQLLRHASLVPAIKDRIVSTEVECLTFSSLCARHGIESLDLLVVDTEGQDFEVIRQVDFGEIKPRLLIYEHLHLAPDDRAACDQLLAEAGYEQKREFFDTFCLDTAPPDRLTRRWRGMSAALPPVFAEP